MSRLTAVLVAWQVVACAAVVQANDRQSMEAWLKYLKGEWTSELDDGTEVIKGTAVWRMAAKRNAAIGRFKDGDVTGIEIGGWRSDKKISQINGFDSKGDYWQLEYKTISANGGEGPIRGTYQGKAYTGNIVVKVIDDDHWHWTIKGKNADGEAFTLSSKLTRKSD